MKISELPELTALSGDEYAVVSYGNKSWKVKLSRIGAGSGPSSGGSPPPANYLPGSPVAVYGSSLMRSNYSGATHIFNNGVLTWYDQSGNNYNVAASSANITWSNGAVFDGASNLIRPIFSTKRQSFSCYVLATALSPTNGQLMVNGSGSANPNNGFAMGFGGSTQDNQGSNFLPLIQQIQWGNGIPYTASSKVFANVCNVNNMMFGSVDSSTLVQQATSLQNPPTDTFAIGGAVALGTNRYLRAGNKIRAVAWYDYDTALADEHDSIVSYLSSL